MPRTEHQMREIHRSSRTIQEIRKHEVEDKVLHRKSMPPVATVSKLRVRVDGRATKVRRILVWWRQMLRLKLLSSKTMMITQTPLRRANSHQLPSSLRHLITPQSRRPHRKQSVVKLAAKIHRIQPAKPSVKSATITGKTTSRTP